MNLGIDGNEANVENRVGSGQYTIEILRQFSKIRSNKVEVFLKEKPAEELPQENSNFTYKVFGPKKLWTQIALPLRLVSNKKLNVFFSPAHYGPRFSRVPYVVTIHDLSYLHFPKLFNKDDLYQLKNWSKYSIEKSAHIIAVSKSTKEDIVKNYNVKADKVTVIYEGYDKRRFKKQTKEKIEKIKTRYKIKGDYIIFVGTLQPRKNVEKLMEAFNILIQNQDPNVQNLSLVIAGKKGWLYDRIFKKANSLSIKNKIIFTDFVPDEDLPAIVSGAKVYVLPSLWEGFGIPVIEAQACGVPVVVSNGSSLPEIVGESGILVDPNSPNEVAAGIRKALEPENSQNLVKAGLENIKRFSWENCAKETLQVLEKASRKK